MLVIPANYLLTVEPLTKRVILFCSFETFHQQCILPLHLLDNLLLLETVPTTYLVWFQPPISLNNDVDEGFVNRDSSFPFFAVILNILWTLLGMDADVVLSILSRVKGATLTLLLLLLVSLDQEIHMGHKVLFVIPNFRSFKGLLAATFLNFAPNCMEVLEIHFVLIHCTE